MQSGYDYCKIRKVFFTHHHLDHNSDFLALLKAQQLTAFDSDAQVGTINVYGPTGTQHHVAQLLELYDYLTVDVDVTELEDGDSIRVGSGVASVRATKHSVPSIAYRMKRRRRRSCIQVILNPRKASGICVTAKLTC